MIAFGCTTPRLHPFAHVGDGLVDPRAELVQAAQVSLVILHRRQRLGAFAAGVIRQHHRQAVHLGDRQQVLGEGLEAQRGGQFVVEDVVAGLVALRQGVAVDRVQALHIALVQRELGGAVLRRDRHADLVVEAAVAALAGRHRVEARQRVVVLVGQLVQALRVGASALR
jgi:hypothetical protein